MQEDGSIGKTSLMTTYLDQDHQQSSMLIDVLLFNNVVFNSHFIDGHRLIDFMNTIVIMSLVFLMFLQRVISCEDSGHVPISGRSSQSWINISIQKQSAQHTQLEFQMRVKTNYGELQFLDASISAVVL